MQTSPTQETCSLIKPRQISDLITMALEGPAQKWLMTAKKIEGQNEIRPWYACEKFWASPFLFEFKTRDGVGQASQEDLGNGLTVIASKHPHVIQAILSGRFGAKDGDMLLQAILLGEVKYG